MTTDRYQPEWDAVIRAAGDYEPAMSQKNGRPELSTALLALVTKAQALGRHKQADELRLAAAHEGKPCDATCLAHTSIQLAYIASLAEVALQGE